MEMKNKLVNASQSFSSESATHDVDKMVVNITQLSANFASGVVLNISRILSDSIVVIFVFVFVFNDVLSQYWRWLILGSLLLPLIFILMNSILIRLGKVYNIKLTQITNLSITLFSSRAEHFYLKSDQFLISKLKQLIAKMLSAHAKKQILFLFPRYLIELVVITGLVLVLSLNQNIEVNDVTIFAVAFLRLVPILNSITANLNALSSSVDTVDRLTAVIFKSSELNRLSIFNPSNKHPNPKISTVIELRNYQLYRGNNKILKNPVNFKFKRNCLNVIIGPSGSGKSSLLLSMLGMGSNIQGELFCFGKKINSLREFNNFVSYVPQYPSVLPTTLIQNITLNKNLYVEDERKLNQIIILLGLERLFDKTSRDQLTHVNRDNISGGELYRLALARSLYNDKSIIFLDEPTAALDRKNAKKLKDLLIELKDNITFIVITHDLDLIESADNKLELKHDEKT